MPDCTFDDEDTEREKDLAILRKHANELTERFDAIQIVVVRDNGSKRGSTHGCYGAGNWYARYGAVRAWLRHEERGL